MCLSLSVFLSVCLCLTLCLSVSLSDSLSVFLSLCLSLSVQENSSQTSQLASQTKALQESQEQANKHKMELRRAREAAKSPSGEGRGLADRVSELEGHLRQAEDDKLSLQVQPHL